MILDVPDRLFNALLRAVDGYTPDSKEDVAEGVRGDDIDALVETLKFQQKHPGYTDIHDLITNHGDDQ